MYIPYESNHYVHQEYAIKSATFREGWGNIDK